MARTAAGGVARHLRHSAYVDTDRRQDPACARADGKPLVAGCALRDEPRIDDVSDALPRFLLLGGVRFHLTPTFRADKSWRRGLLCAVLDGRGRVLRAV